MPFLIGGRNTVAQQKSELTAITKAKKEQGETRRKGEMNEKET